MKDHQRYFPVRSAAGRLVAQFVVISNIESQEPARVMVGNERVLRARLADAEFFYAMDQKESLASRQKVLAGMVFQTKLGTLLDKAKRLTIMMEKLAPMLECNATEAGRAGVLAKCDLTTQMVGEFPELQGVMGGYYALNDGEKPAVATAISEHYHPRFAGDSLPKSRLGMALSLVDKCDTLVGNFGIGQIPTADKDPYALRRAALGVLRIIIGKDLPIDLHALIQEVASTYSVELNHRDMIQTLMKFFYERMRAWYQEQGIEADVFTAVTAPWVWVDGPRDCPADINHRIAAVRGFKSLPEARDLSLANKRVSNILAEVDIDQVIAHVNPQLFECDAERKLDAAICQMKPYTRDLYRKKDYVAILTALAELKPTIDHFFDEVMVMTDDASRRENRLRLLYQLRNLFLQVADIALLQS